MEQKQFHPAEYGFVLTTAQVDTYLHRTDSLESANLASDAGFNPAKMWDKL